MTNVDVGVRDDAPVRITLAAEAYISFTQLSGDISWH